MALGDYKSGREKRPDHTPLGPRVIGLAPSSLPGVLNEAHSGQYQLEGNMSEILADVIHGVIIALGTFALFVCVIFVIWFAVAATLTWWEHR